MADKVIVVKTCPFCHKERSVTFPEWAERLEFSDRRRLMNFLWNNEDWHSTCLREEDAPYADPNSHKLPQ